MSSIHAFPKGRIGRNEPCPCGSRKKYKTCHLERAGTGPSVSGGEVEEQDPPLVDAALESLLPGLRKVLEGPRGRRVREPKRVKPTGLGRCVLCRDSVAPAKAAAHLRGCMPQGAEERIHLQIASSEFPEYWLQALIRADATLEHLDEFLRGIWLECCGHLSAFDIGSVRYERAHDTWEREYGPTPKSMRTRVVDATGSAGRFTHEYDFGSTTHLTLEVLGRLAAEPRKATVLLGIRNNPPVNVCACRKPATHVCTECMWSGPSLFCVACLPDHECGEEMALPLVNSPRVGVCGYTGPAEVRASRRSARRR